LDLAAYHERCKGDDDAETRKFRAEILEELKSEMSCRCDDRDNSAVRSFSCTDGEDDHFFECPQDHVCNQDMFIVNFGVDPDMGEAKRKHCKPARKCNEEDLAEKCGNIYHFPNPTNTHKVCKREKYCERDECCTTEAKFQLKSWRKGSKESPSMCMSETRQDAVEMRSCNERMSNQQWKWKDVGSGTHLLVNYGLGKCIQAEGDQHYVSLKDCEDGSVKQHWRYISDSATILNPDSRKVLDVGGAEQYIADKTGVIIWGDNQAIDYKFFNHQMWHILPVNDNEVFRKFQEGVEMADVRGGISASLACVSTFAILASVPAARALRSKWNLQQDTEDFDTFLRSDDDA